MAQDTAATAADTTTTFSIASQGVAGQSHRQLRSPAGRVVAGHVAGGDNGGHRVHGLAGRYLTAVAITRNGGSACGGERLCTGAAEGDSIRVVLTYRASPIVPVPGVDTVEITGEGQSRCEYS